MFLTDRGNEILTVRREFQIVDETVLFEWEEEKKTSKICFGPHNFQDFLISKQRKKKTFSFPSFRNQNQQEMTDRVTRGGGGGARALSWSKFDKKMSKLFDFRRIRAARAVMKSILLKVQRSARKEKRKNLIDFEQRN